MGFLIIDGNSILNRAFYGIRVLTNSRGVATNAVTGFMNTLLMLEKDVNPDMIAVAFDLKAPTFRHKMYDGYKANRKGCSVVRSCRVETQAGLENRHRWIVECAGSGT